MHRAAAKTQAGVPSRRPHRERRSRRDRRLFAVGGVLLALAGLAAAAFFSVNGRARQVEAAAPPAAELRSQPVDRDALNAQADEILAEILTEDMSGLDKVNAIYDYVTGTVVYLDRSVKGDWIKAAYDGLNLHEGDCYVFACTSRLLLTRAGIPNMDIAKSTASGTHYWNLVDLGEGWYHFDATPHVTRPRIVLWTDAQLMFFSSNHGNTHDYDHSQYPDVN